MLLEQYEKNAANFFYKASTSLIPNTVKHIKKKKEKSVKPCPSWHTTNPLKMTNRLNPTIVEPSSQLILGIQRPYRTWKENVCIPSFRRPWKENAI